MSDNVSKYPIQKCNRIVVNHDELMDSELDIPENKPSKIKWSRSIRAKDFERIVNELDEQVWLEMAAPKVLSGTYDSDVLKPYTFDGNIHILYLNKEGNTTSETHGM